MSDIEGLFAPRPPLRWVEPIDVAPQSRCTPAVGGVSGLLSSIRQELKAAESWTTTAFQQHRQVQIAKRKASEERLNAELARWAPQKDPNAKGNPHATLFIGRLRYSADEDDIEKALGRFGPIRRIHIVKHDGKSRGYAFISYASPSEARTAARQAQGMLIQGRRIVAEIERGRRQPSWRPRRLGMGLGGRFPRGARPSQGPSVDVSPRGPDSGFRPRSRDNNRGRNGGRPGDNNRRDFRDGGDRSDRGFRRGPRDFDDLSKDKRRPKPDYRMAPRPYVDPTPTAHPSLQLEHTRKTQRPSDPRALRKY